MESRVSRHRYQRRKPLYRRWWIWLIALVIVILFINGVKSVSNRSLFLDIDRQTVQADTNGQARVNFRTNKDNNYFVEHEKTKLIFDEEKATTGEVTLKFSYPGKYRIVVFKDGKYVAKTILVREKVSDKEASDTESDDSSTNDISVSDGDTGNQQSESAQKDDASTQVSPEYKSALNKAKDYASEQYMSQQGIYRQLTSEYGEKFSADAAQYAIDNLQVDYNANALKKAKEYQSEQDMSPEAIRDQLTSEYGEQFTPEQADYAIQHLND